MARKKGYKATAADVIINGTLISAALGFSTSLYTGDSLLPWVANAGFLGACLIALAQRNTPGATQRVVEMARDAPRLVTDKHGQQYLQFKDRTVVPTEFVFSGRGLSMGVPYSDMLRFCRLAQRRTGLARKPGTGITARDILSKGYFTKRYHEPFLPEEYETIHNILRAVGLWREREQGKSGRLYHIESLSPTSYTDLAQQRWTGAEPEHVRESPTLPNLRVVNGRKWQLV